jgi:hypothetical protein
MAVCAVRTLAARTGSASPIRSRGRLARSPPRRGLARHHGGFVVAGSRIRGVAAVPVVSMFAEVNMRTYVTTEDKSGVLFLSLHAASIAAMLGARG